MYEHISVELIDKMGTDNTVVDAARVSFSKEAANYTEEQNSKLIKYLAKHNHWSPSLIVLCNSESRLPSLLPDSCRSIRSGLLGMR